MKNKNLKNILKYASLLFTIAMFSLLIVSACSENSVTPEDRAPTITKRYPTQEILIKHIGDVINFKAEGSDPDGDDYSFKGILDGSEVPLIIDGEMASYLFNAVERGNYSFEMIAENTEADTAKWLINVENSKPIINNVILLPDNPSFQDTAKLSFDTYDADGDDLTDVIEWYVNNALTQTGGKSLSLEGLNFEDIVKATIEVYDGTAYSQLKTSNQIVMTSGPDTDGDGIPDFRDSCPLDYNLGIDWDSDGIDDACDPEPRDTLTFGLYDNFDGLGGEQLYDGTQLAVAGEFSEDLWSSILDDEVIHLNDVVNDEISSGANPAGYIGKINGNKSNTGRLFLKSTIDDWSQFEHYKSWSVDILLVDSGEGDYGAVMDYHTMIPEQGGLSWYSQIGIKKETNGRVYINANMRNKNTDYVFWRELGDAQLNTWYNLRMDITPISETEIRVDFYVNGELKASDIPPDGEILLNPSRLGAIPGKILSSNGTALIDNIFGSFRTKSH